MQLICSENVQNFQQKQWLISSSSCANVSHTRRHRRPQTHCILFLLNCFSSFNAFSKTTAAAAVTTIDIYAFISSSSFTSSSSSSAFHDATDLVQFRFSSPLISYIFIYMPKFDVISHPASLIIRTKLHR